MQRVIAVPLTMPALVVALWTAVLLVVAPPSTNAQDSRELVQLPAGMQDDMLASMRDRLAALNRVIAAVGEGKLDDVVNVAEQRLGMSSLTLYGANHIAASLPKPMQDLQTTMHQAGSRLALVLHAASTDPTAQALRGVTRAIAAVTATCEACHAHYRLH